MRILTVKCPACREVMEINSRTGKVEKHHPEVKTKAGGDFLKERLRSLEEEKARREAVVAESRTREATKKEAHDELFTRVKKTAREEPKPERPLRDIDLD